MSFINRFVEWSHQCLLDNELAQQYLLGRGVSKDQWSRHRLGYVGGHFDVDTREDKDHSDDCLTLDANPRRCDSCRYRNWSSAWVEEDGRKCQLIGQNILDSLVLPLTSYSGTCTGFQIRSRVEKSYDTFVLKRRPEGYFFGTSAAMESIWHTKEVYLTEGGFDGMLIERLVTPNVLALTTSSISESHTKFLRRFVKRIYLCFDLDNAGRHGVKKFITEHGHEFDWVFDVKYPRLNDKMKDISDLWKITGDVGFKRHFIK